MPLPRPISRRDMTDNPLIELCVNYSSLDLNPVTEIGVDDTQFAEYLTNVVMNFAAQQEPEAMLDGEDLMFLVAIGTVIGVQFERSKKASE